MVNDTILTALKSHDVDLEQASGESHRQLPVPPVFLGGSDGVIRFVYANPDYRIRVSPQLRLAAVAIESKGR